MHDHQLDAQELRRRAELRLNPDGHIGNTPRTVDEMARLVYELQVHQIELEMQNDELRATRDEGEALLARYTDLYDFAPVGYMSLDRAGTIEQINLLGASLLGLERSWLVRRRMDLFLELDDRREFAAFLENACASDARASCTLTPPQKNRAVRILRLDGQRATVGPGCRVVLTDITATHRAEEAVQLRSAALEAADSAIMITDITGTIEWVNPSFCTMTGYAADEIVGGNPRLFKSGTHEDAFYRDLWDTIGRGEVWRGEITNRRKDGSTYVEERTIAPFRNVRGQLAHHIAIGRDLTDQRLLSAQIIQSAKMETVGRLAGGIAHDFNNLLTVINGTADLAMGDLTNPTALRRDLDEIHAAGRRAATLTRQLLAFSRQQEMSWSTIDVQPLLVGVQQLLHRLIGEHITLTLDVAPGTRRVRADHSQLEQVLMNLAVNARDAMPLGGALRLSARNEDISYSGEVAAGQLAAGAYTVIEVTDTGEGMAEPVRLRAFEPFFTTKATGKGTGLGLAMVYGIVKESGGSIVVRSAIGEGTTFLIYLPSIPGELSTMA